MIAGRRAAGAPLALAALLLLAVTQAPRAAPAGPLTLEDCDVLVARHPNDIDSYTCYGRLARGPRQTGEAIRRLEAHLAVDADNDLARIALAYLDRLQGGDRAEELYRRAIAGLARGAPTALEANTRVFLANLLDEDGRGDEAVAELERAARAAERLGDPRVTAFVALERARGYNRRSDFRAAERLLREFEGRFRNADARLHAAWCSVLGYSYWGERRHGAALELFREQAELQASIGDVYEETTARYNVLLLQTELNPTRARVDPEGLRAAWEALLGRAERSGNIAIASSAHQHLAELGTVVGWPVAERRGHLRSALDLAQRTADRLVALRGLGLSLILDSPRDEERGFAMLDQAAERARTSGQPAEEARCATVLASVRRELARRSGWQPELRRAALEASTRALERVEALRRRQPERLVQARVFARWTFVYDEAAASFLDDTDGAPARENLEFATQVLERKRAQVLLDQLDAAKVPRLPDGPEAVERGTVLDRLGAVQRSLLGGPAPARREELLRELESLEEREAELHLRLERRDTRPGYGPARALPTLDEIASALQPDEAILSYLMEAGKAGADFAPAWVIVHTREQVRAHPLPPAEQLEPAIDLLLGLIDNRDGLESAGAMRLFDALLAPALDGLPPGIARLVLVPDGALHRLPFAMLRARPADAPLGARFGISTVPSIETWMRWRRDGGGTEGEVLALADPAFAAPSGPGSSAPQRRGDGADPLSFAATLGPLPHARRETRALDRGLHGVQALLGEAASEHALKRLTAAPIALLHLGAHAVVDDAHPERSAILLAPGDPTEDGLLQAREIVDLRPGPRVVVLSACRSASGETLDGEGPMSLARPFFVAGAHAVLGSLWPLRDDEAATFFVEFYRHLVRGASLQDALAATRRRRLAAGAPAAAWAGVVLLGDGSAVPFPAGAAAARRDAGWSGSALAAGIAAAIAALVAIVSGILGWRRRRVHAG